MTWFVIDTVSVTIIIITVIVLVIALVFVVALRNTYKRLVVPAPTRLRIVDEGFYNDSDGKRLELELEWHPVEGAKKYRIFAGSTPDFVQIDAHQAWLSDKPYVTVIQRSLERVYYKVDAINKYLAASPTSKPIHYDIDEQSLIINRKSR